jgi:hypothetical protein
MVNKSPGAAARAVFGPLQVRLDPWQPEFGPEFPGADQPTIEVQESVGSRPRVRRGLEKGGGYAFEDGDEFGDFLDVVGAFAEFVRVVEIGEAGAGESGVPGDGIRSDRVALERTRDLMDGKARDCLVMGIRKTDPQGQICPMPMIIMFFRGPRACVGQPLADARGSVTGECVGRCDVNVGRIQKAAHSIVRDISLIVASSRGGDPASFNDSSLFGPPRELSIPTQPCRLTLVPAR